MSLDKTAQHVFPSINLSCAEGHDHDLERQASCQGLFGPKILASNDHVPPRWAPAAMCNSSRTQGIQRHQAPRQPLWECAFVGWGGTGRFPVGPKHREASVTFPRRRALENRSRNRAHPVSSPVSLAWNWHHLQSSVTEHGLYPSIPPRRSGLDRELDFPTSSQVILRTAALTCHVIWALTRWRGGMWLRRPRQKRRWAPGEAPGPQSAVGPRADGRVPWLWDNNRSVWHRRGIFQGSALQPVACT